MGLTREVWARRATHCLGWLLVGMFLTTGVGCSSDSAATQGVPTAAPATFVPQPTPEPAAPTETPERLEAQPTRTPVATLSEADRDALLRELLGTNGGCALPCLWGMAPGRTDAEVAWRKILELGAQVAPDDDGNPASGSGRAFLESGAVNVGLSTVERDGAVHAVDLFAECREDPFALQTDWSRYSLSNVLSAHGVPERAFLEAVLEVGDDPYSRRYALWLFYDQSGFAIRYSGSATVVGAVVRVCPGWAGPGGIDTLRFLTQPPGGPAPLEAMTGYTDEQLQYVWPIELASGLTVEAFHDLYMQGDGLDCFEMPMGPPVETAE